MTFEYTPPKERTEASDKAYLEATTFKPNPKHAAWCPKAELPTRWQPTSVQGPLGNTRMGAPHQCACHNNPLARSLRKLAQRSA